MIIQDPAGGPAGQNGGGCLHLKTVTDDPENPGFRGCLFSPNHVSGMGAGEIRTYFENEIATHTDTLTMLKKEHLPEFVLPPAHFSWENGPVICILKFQKLEMVLESNSQVFRIHHQGEVRGLDEYELREVGGSSGGEQSRNCSIRRRRQ